MPKEAQPPDGADPKKNRLLASLKPADFDALMHRAKVAPLKLRRRLYRQDNPIDAVYFPTMVSLLVSSNNKPQMEMATVGREGVLGASELIQGQGAMGLNLVQIPGNAVRIAADAFRDVLRERPLVRDLMHQHLFALMRQVLYGAACNRLHSMEERCARWLLMTHDRAGQDNFPLTQEFLAHMLGVRRATVNVATGMLKKAGFVRYVRGNVTLIDRRGLESASCECYRAITRAYDSILPAPSK
jgi:CRP-like cAMP-binding protein